MSTKSTVRGRLMASTVLGAMLFAAPAFAQDQVEELVVTGSRIARQDLESTSPLATVGQAEMKASGVVNTENLLATLPQAVPGITSTINNGNGGFATVNLRGLGSNRTLVLVDGKRQTPTSSFGTVDVNLIPPALIDRIEVVTGGGSAVYGSDAIAGVVNFILRKDFEGVDFNLGYSITDNRDAPTYSADYTMGSNVADGRGNVTLSLGYNKRESLLQADRGGKLGFAWGEPPAGGTNLIFSGSGAEINGRVQGSARGTGPNGGGITPADSALFLPDGNVRLYRGAPDTYNFAPINYMQTPQDRYSVTAMGHFDLTDKVEAFAKGNFVNSKIEVQLAETPLASRPLRFTLDNNPFLSDAAKRILNGLGSTTPYTFGGATVTDVDTDGDGIFDTVSGSFNRRLAEVGPRIQNFNFTGFQLQSGLRGKFDAINGQWETFIQYGNTHGSSYLRGDTSLSRIQQGLLLNAAGTACQDPSNGCVPINLFGAGRMSQAAVNFISTAIGYSQDFEEIVASGFLSGDTANFLNLPAGPIGFSLGTEYRSDEFTFRPSQDLATGNLTGFNAQPPVHGYIDVYEASGEAIVPLLKDMPFFKALNLELAGRVSDYSVLDKLTYTYKVAGTWEVNDELTLRGSYNRAVRAPSVAELYRSQGNSFPTATDPCSRQGNPSAAVRQACINSGMDPSLVGVVNANAQTQQISGGNPNLDPERADTLTVGLVYQPSFISNLAITIDYFDIEIKDLIASFGGGAANVMGVCYGPIINGSPTSPYCQAIKRLSNGNIDFVSQQDQNVAVLKTAGLDIALTYRFAVEDLGLPDWGNVAIRSLYTNTWESTLIPDDISPAIKCADKFGTRCATVTPRHKLRTTFNWTMNDVSAALVWNYIDDVRDDNPSVKYVHEDIGAKNYFDLSVNWKATEHMDVTVGARNLFQEAYPILGGNGSSSSSGYPNVYDVLGRTFFANVGVRF